MQGEKRRKKNTNEINPSWAQQLKPKLLSTTDCRSYVYTRRTVFCSGETIWLHLTELTGTLNVVKHPHLPSLSLSKKVWMWRQWCHCVQNLPWCLDPEMEVPPCFSGVDIWQWRLLYPWMYILCLDQVLETEFTNTHWAILSFQKVPWCLMMQKPEWKHRVKLLRVRPARSMIPVARGIWFSGCPTLFLPLSWTAHTTWLKTGNTHTVNIQHCSFRSSSDWITLANTSRSQKPRSRMLVLKQYHYGVVISRYHIYGSCTTHQILSQDKNILPWWNSPWAGSARFLFWLEQMATKDMRLTALHSQSE